MDGDVFGDGFGEDGYCGEVDRLLTRSAFSIPEAFSLEGDEEASVPPAGPPPVPPPSPLTREAGESESESVADSPAVSSAAYASVHFLLTSFVSYLRGQSRTTAALLCNHDHVGMAFGLGVFSSPWSLYRSGRGFESCLEEFAEGVSNLHDDHCLLVACLSSASLHDTLEGLYSGDMYGDEVFDYPTMSGDCLGVFDYNRGHPVAFYQTLRARLVFCAESLAASSEFRASEYLLIMAKRLIGYVDYMLGRDDDDGGDGDGDPAAPAAPSENQNGGPVEENDPSVANLGAQLSSSSLVGDALPPV